MTEIPTAQLAYFDDELPVFVGRELDLIEFDHDAVLLYQLKFTKSAPELKPSFYEHIVTHEKLLQKKITKPVMKLLFSYTSPAKKDLQQLNTANFLVSSQLKLLLGERMIKWLEDAKNSTVSV